MGKLSKSAGLFLDHYKKFGWSGISFLIKRRNSKNKIVEISVPELKYPVYMRNRTTDIPMFYCIFSNREMDFYLDFEPSIIVDCGAHIGLSAVLFANRYPKAKIYAIEPEASNYELLLRNTKPYENIICINKAIWNENTTVKINDVGLGNWGFMTEEAASNEAGAVPSISLTDLMTQFDLTNIDLCKINIEGAEKELFQKNYEPWLSNTQSLIIELHDHMKPGCSATFFKALENYHYKLSLSGSYVVVKDIKNK